MGGFKVLFVYSNFEVSNLEFLFESFLNRFSQDEAQIASISTPLTTFTCIMFGITLARGKLIIKLTKRAIGAGICLKD